MERQFPKVGVIVPVYKVEKYLEKCVNSLLRQTYKNLEILLIDDGSPDTCPQMCDSFAAKNKRVKALHKENGGLGDARNYGVANSECDWIVFVDSDDYVEPEYVEVLVNLRNQFDADMVITRTSREPEDGSAVKTNDKFPAICVDRETALFEVYSGGKVGWAAYGKLYRKDVLLNNPFPAGLYEDCACMYRIITENEKIVIADYENNYHYIERQGSLLKSSLNEHHLHIFDICDEFRDFIEKEYPQLDILPVLVYRRGVTQLLNLQNMPWETYKTVFYKYHKMFRKNLLKVLRDSRVTIKSKVHFIMLCTTPGVYQLQNR